MATASTKDAVINAILAAASGRPIPTPERLQMPMPSLSNTPTASRTPIPSGASEMVFSVRAPKQTKKKMNVMRFNSAHKVDFSHWKAANMQREDNSKQFKPIKSAKEALPKFGAGSEFGRDKREAARRRKYGMYRKKYKPQDQPWVLKIKENLAKKTAIPGRPGQPAPASSTAPQVQQRKFRGTIEGGFKDNSSYYIFEQKAGGIIEAYPVHQWINFTPVQTYKALTAEEAEEEFGRRTKNLNLFTLMAKKRWKLQNDEGEDEEGKAEGGGGGKGKKKDPKSLRVSEMDEWDDDEDDDEGSDEGGADDADKKAKKGKGKGKQAPKKKKKGSDDEALEDSDDGDEEGLELDYISDSSEPSEDEDDKKPELAGVDQEKGGMLESESSDDENAEKKKAARNAERDGDKEKNEQEDGEEVKSKIKKHKKKDKSKKKHAREGEDDGGAGGSGVNMPDLNSEERKTDMPGPNSGGVDSMDASGSDSMRKDVLKRKAAGEHDGESSSKKSKLVEVDPALLQLAVSEGITEEAVRKYLLRKPMTVAELLQKFKQKQHKISNEDMVPIIAHLLKKINPQKSKSQTSKLYFFLKPK